jgi:K+ transporter
LTAFAPADDPQIAITVMVERGIVASNIGGAIVTEINKAQELIRSSGKTSGTNWGAGFLETVGQNVPSALELVKSDSPELYFDPYKSTYFTSTIEPVIVKNRKMALWRKRIFLLLSHNANSKSDYFKLPTEHTIEMTTFIEL